MNTVSIKSFSIFESAFELRDKLNPYKSEPLKMREAFDGYMLEKHNAPAGSMEYQDLVEIFTKKAGMRREFEMMGVRE